ncbi:MAG: hypothetical protein IH984_05265 [Planctomycetes bacterium]|nr:hypothetical protein [Planctomycetota bacterium]
MLVKAIRIYHIRIPLKTPFQHALHERKVAESLIVCAADEDGRVGFGEIVPRQYLTGETVESVFDDHAPALAAAFVGRKFDDKEQLLSSLITQLENTDRELATLCGFELALLDLGGHCFGFPIGEAISIKEGVELERGIVIGYEVSTDKLPRQCAMLKLGQCKHLKLKVGLDDDLERIQIISDCLGDTIELRIDANGKWKADEAVLAIKPMLQFEIQSVEQPVHAADLKGMRQVREELGIRVMGDESVCTLEDAKRCVEAQAIDIINVRLGKCGGFGGSQRLVKFALENNIACHLGTLVGETGILSRASEIFGKRMGVFACLEGKGQSRFLLEDDIIDIEKAGESKSGDGMEVGLGIIVDSERLARYTIKDRVFNFEGEE